MSDGVISIDKEGEKSILTGKKNYRFLTTLIWNNLSWINRSTFLLPSNFVLPLIKTEPKAGCVFVVVCVMYLLSLLLLFDRCAKIRRPYFVINNSSKYAIRRMYSIQKHCGQWYFQKPYLLMAFFWMTHVSNWRIYRQLICNYIRFCFEISTCLRWIGIHKMFHRFLKNLKQILKNCILINNLFTILLKKCWNWKMYPSWKYSL